MRSRTVRPLRRRDHGAGQKQNGDGYSGSHAQVRQARQSRQTGPHADQSYGMQHSVYAVPRKESDIRRKKRTDGKSAGSFPESLLRMHSILIMTCCW